MKRVKVAVHNEIKINKESERNSFFLIDNDFKKIADLRYVIIRKLGLKNFQSEFYLSIEGFLIRSNETINILRDNDCILLSLYKENITKRKKDIYDNTKNIKQKSKKRKKEEMQELYEEDSSSIKLLKIPKKIETMNKKTKILSKKSNEKNRNDIFDKNNTKEIEDKKIINSPTQVDSYVDAKSMWNYLNENQAKLGNVVNNSINVNNINTSNSRNNNVEKKVNKNVKSKLRTQQLVTTTKSKDINMPIDAIYSNITSSASNSLGKWNEDNDNYTLYPLVMEYSSLKHGDILIYKTIELCEDTWQPINSVFFQLCIFVGLIQEIHPILNLKLIPDDKIESCDDIIYDSNYDIVNVFWKDMIDIRLIKSNSPIESLEDIISDNGLLDDIFLDAILKKRKELDSFGN